MLHIVIPILLIIVILSARALIKPKKKDHKPKPVVFIREDSDLCYEWSEWPYVSAN